MEVPAPALTFPTTFCCNCGALDCVKELQDTRVTRYFGIGGTETTFNLPVPVCAGCRRSTRRRPSGFFSRLLVVAVTVAVLFLALLALGAAVELPVWFVENMFWVSLVLGVLGVFGFYRLRRPRPPQTSFYQPVRIRIANLQFTDVVGGASNLVFMKLAFTNPDYLDAFRNANQDSIKSGLLEAVKA